MPQFSAPQIRSATTEDLPSIDKLIKPFVEQRKLLPRTANELETLILNGFVAELDDQIVGFAAVEIYSRKLAELLCLAVAESCQGRGTGRALVKACVARAGEYGVREVMAITSSETFLQTCGFDFTLPDQRKALFIRPAPVVDLKERRESRGRDA